MRMLRLGIVVMCALLAACTTAPEIKQALAAKGQAYGEHQRLMQQYRELVSNITARHEGYATLKDDGERDSFADHDVAIRRANPDEDIPGVFGARGQLGYNEDNQGVQEQDIVFWYVAHLPHMAAIGPTKWLTLGPTLKVQR